MSNFVDLDTQKKIKNDFETEFAKGLASATAVRRLIAGRYDKAYSTICKITNNGYKLEAAKSAAAEIPQKISKPKINPNLQLINTKKAAKTTRTLIFTSWEIRVGVDPKFVDILNQIKNYYSGEAYVSSVWPDDLAYMPPSLYGFQVLQSDLDINNNLMFKYVPTHALAMSPIQGWAGAHDKTIILPGLVRDIITEKSHKLSKQIIATGSIGKLNAFLSNYKHVTEEESRVEFVKRWSKVQNRRGGRSYEIAKQFTVPTALIVDILDDETFFTRYVTMERSGIVYDKGLKFIAGKSKPAVSRPKALYLGDIHAVDLDEDNMLAVEDMCQQLKPESIVAGDVFDGASCNPHELGDYSLVYKFPSLQEEGQTTRNVIERLLKLSDQFYYLISNHDDFLVRYLAKEENYKVGRNYKDAIALRLWQLENPARHPVEGLLELDSFKRLKVVYPHETLTFAGTLVKHGHESFGGRRLGFRAQQKVYNKVVIGHVHTPEFYRNGAAVGVSCILKPSYVMNGSVNSWLHSHALIHPDGSIQLLNVIYGKWTI